MQFDSTLTVKRGLHLRHKAYKPNTKNEKWKINVPRVGIPSELKISDSLLRVRTHPIPAGFAERHISRKKMPVDVLQRAWIIK